MNQEAFTYQSFPYQLHYGDGKISVLSTIIPTEDNVLVVCTSDDLGVTESLLEKVEIQDATILPLELEPSSPGNASEELAKTIKDEHAGTLVAIGDAPLIKLAQQSAAEAAISLILVPTTYANAAMAPALKMAAHVIYDTEITVQQDFKAAIPKIFTTMAHLIESIYAPGTNPITYHSSLHGLKQLMIGIHISTREKRLTNNSNNLLTTGAMLGGKAFAEVGLSIQHRLVETLEAQFGIDSFKAHTVLLPFVVEFQWNAMTEKLKDDLKKSLIHPYPPNAIMDAIKVLEAPTSLEQISISNDQLSTLQDAVLKDPVPSLREVNAESLTELLNNAWEGKLIGDRVNA